MPYQRFRHRWKRVLQTVQDWTGAVLVGSVLLCLAEGLLCDVVTPFASMPFTKFCKCQHAMHSKFTQIEALRQRHGGQPFRLAVYPWYF